MTDNQIRITREYEIIAWFGNWLLKKYFVCGIKFGSFLFFVRLKEPDYSPR